MNYADHYYSLGETVRQTVKEAQDILARLAYHKYAEEIREQQAEGREYTKRALLRAGAIVSWPAGPPQSLGELCIELAQDKYLGWQMDIEDGLIWVQSDDSESENWLKNPDQIQGFGTETRRDIQELRIAMYHKHRARFSIDELNMFWENLSRAICEAKDKKIADLFAGTTKSRAHQRTNHQ